MIDEDPSDEDIERFDRETAFCPDCGEEVWDQAEICPKCHAFIGGQTLTRQPIERWVSRRAMMLIIAVLAVIFSVLWLLCSPAGF